MKLGIRLQLLADQRGQGGSWFSVVGKEEERETRLAPQVKKGSARICKVE